MALGRRDSGEILVGYAAQLGWIAIAVLVLSLAWRRATSKYSALAGKGYGNASSRPLWATLGRECEPLGAGHKGRLYETPPHRTDVPAAWGGHALTVARTFSRLGLLNIMQYWTDFYRIRMIGGHSVRAIIRTPCSSSPC